MADKAPTFKNEDEAIAYYEKLGMQRRAEAATAAEAAKRERYKPLSDLTASPAFAEVKNAIEALPNDFMADMDIAPHIMALRAGFNGFSQAFPAPAAPAPDAAQDDSGGASA